MIAQKKDLRTSERRPSRLQQPVNVLRATQEGQWLVTVRDISMDGIGLAINEPFPIGAILTIELPAPNGLAPRLLRVKNARQNPGNTWWTVGCAFAQSLTLEEVEFLRKKTPFLVPPRERRSKVRHTTRLKQPCRVLRMTIEGPWPLSIRNVSETGIGLIGERPFKAGALLTVELPAKPKPKPALLRVVYTRKQPESGWWVIGCAFAKKITSAEVDGLV
jgi:hypothetical protein